MGELWLFSDGLLRVRSGWTATLRQSESVERMYRPVRAVEREFSIEEIAAAEAEHATNYWIPAANLRRAALRHGILNDRLNVEMSDGRRIKLLWLRKRRSETFDPLEAAMKSWGVAGMP